jgi:ribokinase
MKTTALNFDPLTLKFTGIIGTGGLGSGKFFQLNGDQTLGREESRSGHFLKVHDYCKQHIILHYVKVLLGDHFPVIPIGNLGNDDIGNELWQEMSSTGFSMKYISKLPDSSTLFSLCYYYPDGTGGNLTTDNSASSWVSIQDIEKARAVAENLAARGMVMAAPEVPMEARSHLLKLGREHGLFCSASFTSEELGQDNLNELFPYIDLLAINLEEAAALTKRSLINGDAGSVVDAAIKKLIRYNCHMMVSVTAGKKGSSCWNGREMQVFPAAKTTVKSTAGAGDAFFSGLIIGMALGCSLFEAQELASLIAGCSVSSEDTIHHGINRNLLHEFMHASELNLSEKIIKVLED